MKKAFPVFALLIPFFLEGATLNVTSTSDDPMTSGTLPYAIINSNAGDTIDCGGTGGIAGMTITLTSSLPPITKNLTITVSGGTVGINGSNLYSAFSAASGTVVLQNFTVTNALSLGGDGGSGEGGGGGGVGGGPGLYVHNGANVSLINMQFNNNNAEGGAGGAFNMSLPGGGGGGGFNGGVGGQHGGGGGGNAGGGAGGADMVAGSAGTNSAGGGGGGYNAAGGASGSFTGGSSNATGGGGGAGAGGNGQSAAGPAGDGGVGIGADTFYGGGGGGGATGMADGGAGFGTAGGGGGFVGGAGGTSGGGGGGGNGGAGGNGGFGGGGGGGSSAGAGGFGGGTGGTGGTADGGGGAALGGAIFVQNGATLTIGDQFSASSNVATGGAAGGGGATGGAGIGPSDIFLRSTGSLVFNNSTSDIAINTAIGGDGLVTSSGGVTVQGSRKVTFTGNNSYTRSTTISSGTLNVNADAALGASANTVALSGGTLQIAASFTSNRAVTLTSNGNVDTQAFNLGLGGTLSGGGSLTKVGSGTLALSGANSFSGGTIINVGTVSIAADTALGGSSGGITFGGGTLQTTSAVNSARAVTMTGAGTIDTQGNTDTFSGAFTGAGALTKVGAGTLILTGTNTYSGGTNVSAGILQGNTTSLQGNIANSGAVVFNQSSGGTYSGILTGAGSLAFQGGGTYTLSGSSPSFTGPTSLTSGQLIVTGSLAGSTLALSAGTVLFGTGTVGTVNSTGGAVAAGIGSPGTLTISGTLNLDSNSTTAIPITPTATGLIVVNNQANLAGTLQLQPSSGFYGFSGSFLVLTAAPVSGMFDFVESTNSNFNLSESYSATQVRVNYTITRPFLDFPFDNFNERSVGNNLDDLNAAGTLDPELTAIVDSFVGQSFSAINNALDQMHPAQYSAFSELQAQVGGQLISIFHRKPYLPCCSRGNWRLWAEPFGNWLKEKNKGEESGFQSTTYGVAAGADAEILDSWVIGFGGAWDTTNLKWKNERGYASTEGYYGSVYTDYQTDRFYIGAAFLAGQDAYDAHRRIEFPGTDRTASANFDALDMIAQLSTAYFFGTPTALAYPYANVDYLYLNAGSLTEKDAGSLNLHVQSNLAQTIRTEVGVALQVQDTNYYETMCISPMVALGWAMECPLSRQDYVCTFEGEDISFDIRGWDHVWQIFSIDFGLSLAYKCGLVSVRYNAETSAQQHSPFFAQRCNVHLEWKW